jgi:CrcB protein
VSAAVIAAVLLAGAAGAVVRYLVSRLAVHWSSGPPSRYRDFPWAVLIVNVVGSALGGVVLGLTEAGAVSADVRLILLTGFCGGLTTFSTFSVETIQLVLEGKGRTAAVSVVLNLALGILVAALAYLATR